MAITNIIGDSVKAALTALYGIETDVRDFQINQTKPEFEGDYTVVVFALVKKLRKSPDGLGKELGEYLVAQNPGLFSAYNVIKGFLNLTVTDSYWTELLGNAFQDARYGAGAPKGERVMVEYSSPNTNKPLHLGHLRNNFLGWSTAEILKACGYEVVKTCIANDRGIHICKSMVAWQRFAHGATPASTGTKGDHFVGDYYVLFGEEHKKETAALVAGGMPQEEAEKEAPVMKAAQQMLVDWEAGQPDVIALWSQMNAWVYAGFADTYRAIGSDFDKTYYESETYLLGKDMVDVGLEKGVFFQKEDGSVWIDLTDEGLDQKIVRRRDGTSVYITQDIGLAEFKYNEYHCNQSIYVVGDEQNYHFKVLKLICQRLGIPGADGIYHLSYGMVELPTGRMKTREGTVVDADDIVAEMVNLARVKTEELGKVDGFTAAEREDLYHTLGLGALKFFLLRVDPRKRMLFNPEESIDLHGFTATFIQYVYARIRSVLRKEGAPAGGFSTALLPLEKELLVVLEQFPSVVETAGSDHDPSLIANYAFRLGQVFNSFYAEHSIGNAENPAKRHLRLGLAQMTGNVLAFALSLLGIAVPERM
ncbi:arginine--tRNA ligase [Dinghuibacter silviterrae]|uniref:Arginine--tRNA ligase n=1 Tax=Dinghuibacter silviterrae TaxID=1539049 RepID=A0A4R8DI70_9BACT|nr:arginine--tRNA ligase [Dinghuibacter silviterrae]TDW97255.1 arginyl-tRNA synthetase [Dinghuibacter silviterrae]